MGKGCNGWDTSTIPENQPHAEMKSAKTFTHQYGFLRRLAAYNCKRVLSDPHSVRTAANKKWYKETQTAELVQGPEHR